jgi:hypothetical protein
MSQVSVVHENCCNPVLTIENNKREEDNEENARYKEERRPRKSWIDDVE